MNRPVKDASRHPTMTDPRLRPPVIWCLALIVFTLPVLVALAIAHEQSVSIARDQAKATANEVLRRADATADQLVAGTDLLKAELGDRPCTPDGLRRMSALVLRFDRVQGAGYVVGNRLMCSSMGSPARGIDLGPPDLYTWRGYSIRVGARRPFGHGVRLMAVGAPSGYILFLHPRLLLELPDTDRAAAVGIIGRSSGRLIDSRGTFDLKVVRGLLRSPGGVRIVGNRLTAVSLARSGDYAGFAVLPEGEALRSFRNYAILLLPIGIVCGIGLIFLLRAVARQENSLVAVIREALESDQFYLHFQPLVDLRTGRWIGAEALVRWRRLTGEDVRPDIFIPYMEEVGLIGTLTDRVFALLEQEAFVDLCRLGDFYLSVNVASADLRGDRLLGLVKGLLANTGCAPSQLVLEATERGLIDASQGARALSSIRKTGVRVALDDFGTGFSGLSYLQRFEFDYIKIDKSFVESIGTDAPTSSVVTHIINMARDLRLGLIAEGVETEEQRAFLLNSQVCVGQGWLFARAMPWAELIRGLRVQEAEEADGPAVEALP